MAEQTWYSDLTTAEVHTFVGMGLCVSKRLDGWLSCRYCRTSKKRTHCFQGYDQVRAHFTDHDAGGLSVEARAAPATEVSEATVATVASEVRSVWVGAPAPSWAGRDTVTRISGAVASVPRPTAAALLTTAVLQPAGARGGGIGRGMLSNRWKNRQCPQPRPCHDALYGFEQTFEQKDSARMESRLWHNHFSIVEPDVEFPLNARRTDSRGSV